MAVFEPGQSGNPKGRPKGVADRRRGLREMLASHGEELVAKVVEMAMAGDATALRIAMERVLPAIKSKDEPVSLPIKGGTLAEKGEAVLAAIGDGVVPPDVGAGILQAIASQARIVEVDEIERRLAALEAKHEEKA